MGGECHDFQAEPAQKGQKTQDFLGLAAVAQQDREVSLLAQAQVAVEGLGRVEKARGNSGAIEGGRDLLGDMGGFSYAAEDKLGSPLDGGPDGLGCGHKVRPERPRCGCKCLSLNFYAPAGSG